MVGKNLGFVWESKNVNNGSTDYYSQSENKDALTSGQPYSHSYIDLKYPIKVGQSWPLELNGDHTSTITKMNVTVKTPYKIFTNAVEVSSTRKYKMYYVQGIRNVKTIDPSGKVVSELKSIK